MMPGLGCGCPTAAKTRPTFSGGEFWRLAEVGVKPPCSYSSERRLLFLRGLPQAAQPAYEASLVTPGAGASAGTAVSLLLVSTRFNTMAVSEPETIPFWSSIRANSGS